MAARNEPTQRIESASGIVWPRALVLAWGAGLLLYAALVPGGLVDGQAARALTQIVWALAAGLATASCLRAARALSGRDRLAWMLFATACGAWAAGHLVCLGYELLTLRHMPFPDGGDIGQLVLGPLMIVALLELRATQRERRLTWLRTLNLGLILCGLVAVLIGMMAQPFMYAELSLGSSLILIVESAPVTIAFILGLYVLWSYDWENRFEPIALITIALALHMISALFHTRARITNEAGAAIVYTFGWLLAFACQQWAGESQVAVIKHGNLARARALLEREGWVEALVPAVLILCLAVTGIALEEEITRTVYRFGASMLAVFALVLGLREGVLYSRGRQLRRQLQQTSTELEKSREQLRQMDVQRAELQRDIELAARSGGVGLWDWDLLTNDVRLTYEWKRQLGYDDRELSDTFDTWYSRIHPDDRDRVMSLIRNFIANPQGEFVTEHRLRHRDGSYRWSLVHGVVLLGSDGKPRRMLGSHVDITDRKNIELSLRESEQRYRELVDSLEYRVAERTRELTDAYRESQDIAYAVAHDLKAPLRAIDGFSHLLEQSVAERLDAHEQAYIKRVRRGAIHMASLIEALLAYSRLEHCVLRFAAVDCREAVEDALRSMTPAIQAADAVVSVTMPPGRVRADADALSLAIRNLLDNALKFASPSRQPRVDIGGYEEPGFMVISVSDNGIGFNPQYYDKIFEIFNRLHSTGYEGTGIGLALVRKAVRRMQGRVWAKSDVDRGATFYIALPLAREGDQP